MNKKLSINTNFIYTPPSAPKKIKKCFGSNFITNDLNFNLNCKEEFLITIKFAEIMLNDIIKINYREKLQKFFIDSFYIWYPKNLSHKYCPSFSRILYNLSTLGYLKVINNYKIKWLCIKKQNLKPSHIRFN